MSRKKKKAVNIMTLVKSLLTALYAAAAFFTIVAALSQIIA